MKTIIKNIKDNYKLIIGVLILGIIIGWLVSPNSNKNKNSETVVENNEQHDHEMEDATVWTCSMHPQVKREEPGQCPICAMDLIPLNKLESADQIDANAISITESAAKLADIQTAAVQKGAPIKTLYLHGKVQANEKNIAQIAARFNGRIEQLFVNFTGQKVKKGEKLATIYSPELVSAQKELIEALTVIETRPSLYRAAIAKLKLWDITNAQIEKIEQQKEPILYFDVLSPISGTITERNIAKGNYVNEGQQLFQLIDLSNLWVMFDAYESDLPWISINDEIQISLKALPGETISGKVSFIDPFIDPLTRVAKVRVELEDTEGKLKPEMFANGILTSEIAENANVLLIPKSAILWTGKRSVVYVKVPKSNSPTFTYREVLLGAEAGNNYVVIEGLTEGEEIATNGVFKIDASAQLQGLPSMMNPSENEANSEQNHNEMDKSIANTTVPKAFKQQLTDVYNAYIKMKNELIDANAENANLDAKLLKDALADVEMELLKGDAHKLWMSHLKDLNQSITVIENAENIDQQRAGFLTFNQTFYKSVKQFGLSNTLSYYQYCPMADDDQGAYWLSETEEIRNPYFGDMMMSCGETKEQMEF